MGELRTHIVGRERELAALQGFLTFEPGPWTLVLEGGPGLGKTTLWEAGIDVARDRGVRVLSARPSSAEARLSFTAVTDLFEGVDTSALQAVPGPQLHALEVALLRAEPAVSPEPRAIAAGLLNALRALAGDGRLLVAIDDIQWLDPPSADALAFAARRLEGEPVRFLLATRPGSRSALELSLERHGVERLEVGPLSLGATRRLLFEQLGLSVPRHALRRIGEATLGSPLFALEVGRTLTGRGPLEPGEDVPVPDSVEDLLGTRIGQLTDPVRMVLLAVALSGDLRVSQLTAVAEPDAFEDAVAAGVVLVDGERVRPSHPLLAAAARRDARSAERRDLHLALAGVVSDRELCALHLALAADDPDADLAATLAEAAEAAAVRGAARDATVLAEHALRLTPPDRNERSERLLRLGWFLEVAGEGQRVTDLLLPELESLPPGAPRVRAQLLLSEGGGVKSMDDHVRHLEQALAESEGDPLLRADVLAKMAMNTAATSVERIRETEEWALEALPAARIAGPEVERRALYALGWARSLSGRPIDDICQRFAAASDAAFYIAESPEIVALQRRVWRGDATGTRPASTELLRQADDRGEAMSYALQRLYVCELELRAGEWEAVSRLLDEWAEGGDSGLVASTYKRCRALLAAGRGLPGEAEEWGAPALAGAEAIGVRWQELESLRALGIAALLAHDPARAAEHLGRVWEHTRREGVDDPGAFPVAPELVEALVELSEFDEARTVVARLETLAREQEHPWGLATVKRSGALVALAADRYDEEAAAALAEAATDYATLGLRFDRARSLLSLGRAQRRHRKWAAARRSLEQAAAAFEEIGSTGWAEHARSELSRVSARRPQPAGELTPTEQQVVELAAEGMSNKEIAQARFVSVHTVEVHLSHAYAKLGVRSRSQLAARLSRQ